MNEQLKELHLGDKPALQGVGSAEPEMYKVLETQTWVKVQILYQKSDLNRSWLVSTSISEY